MIVPLELGFLAVEATNRGALVAPKRHLSVGLLDERIAGAAFSWYPESVREFASLENGDGTYPIWMLIAFLVAAFSLNGFIGPVVEELYFPRLLAAQKSTVSAAGHRFERGAVLHLLLLDSVAEPGSDHRLAPVDLGCLAHAKREALDRGSRSSFCLWRSRFCD